MYQAKRHELCSGGEDKREWTYRSNSLSAEGMASALVSAVVPRQGGAPAAIVSVPRGATLQLSKTGKPAWKAGTYPALSLAAAPSPGGEERASARVGGSRPKNHKENGLPTPTHTHSHPHTRE